MRLVAVCVAVVLASIAPVAAQAPGERYPGPFALFGSFDVIVAGDGTLAGSDPASSHLSTHYPLWIGGWAVECRSGLQPQTQRTGELFVTWTRVAGRFGEARSSVIYPPVHVVARPDVVTVLQDTCPAVGAQVGFWMLVSPPDEGGTWTVNLDMMTSDGAGRAVWLPTQKKDVFVWW